MRTANPAVAHKTKRSPTQASKKPVSTARGDTENQARSLSGKRKASEPYSQQSDQEYHYTKPENLTQARTYATTAEYNSMQQMQRQRSGATSAASTWSATPASASQASSKDPTERGLMTRFTLWQAKNLFGQTATAVSAFSSLTNIRAALSAKRSSESWMAILSNFRSKADLSTLASLASALRPTSYFVNTPMQLSDDDSNQEDTSDCQDSEDNMESSSDISETEENSSETEYASE